MADIAPRRFTVLALALASAIALTGCTAGAEPAPSPMSTAASPSPTPAPTPEAPVETQEAPVSTTSTIVISLGSTTVRGVLDNNAATTSLLAQLPLELSFQDFGGQEKIAGLPSPLSLDGMPSGGSAEPGTIGYYAPDQAIVLYYEAVGYYNGIIPIGTFDDVAAVRDAAPSTGTITLG